MNILRELRKFKKKSVLVKLQILLLFSVMLIASTYAWWKLPKSKTENLRGTIETWEIEYSIDDNQILEEEVVISVDDFQPGMIDFKKAINIRNFGTKGTKIKYELTSVKLFGEEVLDDMKANDEIRQAGSTVNLFVNSNEQKYPFNICYMYDKTHIDGKYLDDKTTPDSVSKITFFASWDYEKGTDNLDTYIGKKAYEFYNDPNNIPEEVLQFTVKITSEALPINFSDEAL